MGTEIQEVRKEPLTLEEVANSLYTRSNHWWKFSLVVRWGALILGTAVIFGGIPAGWFALITFGLVFFAEAGVLRSSHFKGRAERVKRLHEVEKGLAIKPSKNEMSVLRARYFLRKDDVGVVDHLPGFEFASRTPPGTKRLLENLRESSWWSHHLARMASYRTWALLAIFLLGSVLLLLFATLCSTSTSTIQLAGQVAIALILGTFSLGLIPRALSFAGFSSIAQVCLEEAERLLNADAEADITEGLRNLSEYQIARASSPNLPPSIWEKNRDRLNELYSQHFSNPS